MKKEIAFNNSNLYLHGFGKDTNGNATVQIGFPNQRAFSIQTNGTLPRTHEFRQVKPDALIQSDLDAIEKEIVEYILEHGSKKQKKSLKQYLEKGGFFKSLTDKTKELYKKAKPHVKTAYEHGKRKTKEAYHAGKEKVKDKIHETKKDVALDVIDETIDKVKTYEEKKHLRAAEEIVEENFNREKEELKLKTGGMTNEGNTGSEKNKMIYRYVINAIDPSGYDVVAETDADKIKFLWETFLSEYGWAIKRNGIQGAFTEWLQGLPSSFSIDFENYKIIEIGKEWGILKSDATEKQEDQFLETWWNRLYMALRAAARKNKIDLDVKYDKGGNISCEECDEMESGGEIGTSQGWGNPLLDYIFGS